MSGLDSLHISYLDSDQKGRYSKRLSISSNISSTSSYSPSSDHLSFNNNDDQLQRKTSKKGVSTFINKLFR
jgi:hypothetical protein